VADINAKGGVNGHPLALVIEDNQASATNAVSSFQRMVNQDHVVAVVGTWISEVALALEPWSARLHTPFIVTGAASNDISAFVHKDYAAHKYVFHAYFPSAFLAEGVCDLAHDVLVDQMHMKSAVIISEDAAWTKPLDAGYGGCLPGAGLKVLKEIRFSPDTADFTPIFQQAEALNPDIIISGWAHVGVQPTVQWADQKVPLPLAGINAQAGSSAFWRTRRLPSHSPKNIKKPTGFRQPIRRIRLVMRSWRWRRPCKRNIPPSQMPLWPGWKKPTLPARKAALRSSGNLPPIPMLCALARAT
jgi:branched-chain amino acid transport system substrate-binding protein